MHYYRTKQDIKDLAAEYKAEFTHRSKIGEFVEKKHQVEQRGIFADKTKDKIWLGDGCIKKEFQVKTTKAVLDFLVSSQIYNDVKEYSWMISIFGKLQNEVLTDLIALNHDSLIDQDDLT